MNQILYSEELVYNWVKLLLIITSILILWARAVGGNKIIYLIKLLISIQLICQNTEVAVVQNGVSIMGINQQ